MAFFLKIDFRSKIKPKVSRWLKYIYNGTVRCAALLILHVLKYMASLPKRRHFQNRPLPIHGEIAENFRLVTVQLLQTWAGELAL